MALAAQPYRRPVEVEELMEAYGDVVRRRCHEILGNQSDAEDAAQEVFDRVARWPGTVQNPSAWVLRIAYNVCTDELRRRQREERAYEAAHIHRGVVDPAEMVVSSISAPGMLGRLSRQEKVVVVNRFHDISDEETARLMGITLSTVRNTLARARRKLSSELSAGRVAVLVTLAAGRRLFRRTGAEPAGWTANLMVPTSALVLGLLVGSGIPAAQAPGSASRLSLGVGAVPLKNIEPVGVVDRGAPVAVRLASAAAVAAAPGRPGGGLRVSPPASQPVITPPSPDDTHHTDLALAPDGRTLYASGDGSCIVVTPGANARLIGPAGVPCWALDVSYDKGADWHTVAAYPTPVESSLVMPGPGAPRDRFYAFGPSGLQQTLDGGLTFLPADAGLPRGPNSFAGTAPPYTGEDIVVNSPSQEWLYRADQVPLPGLVNQPGLSSEGAALYSPENGPSAWQLLPVALTPGLLPVSTSQVEVLRCDSQSCSTVFTAPDGWTLSDNNGARTRLELGEDGHTVLAVNPTGLAISTDGEQKVFEPLQPPPSVTRIADAVLTGSGPTARLTVAIAGVEDGGIRGIYSAPLAAFRSGNWGAPATGSLAKTEYQRLLVLGPGSLIASRSKPDVTGDFICSYDSGISWEACLPG